MRRVALAFAVVAAAALASLASTLTDPAPPASDAPPGEPAPAQPASAVRAAAASPTAEPAVRRNAQDGTWWADSLVRPLDDELAADDDDPRAGVLRGRLTVRQEPWVHPAGVELRLTRSWLDSVLPTEVENGTLAPARDELRTTTDADGRFAFRLVPPAGELFFLIGHGTEWDDFQKVRVLPRSGEELDLGEVMLDRRGEIVGRVVFGTRGSGGEVFPSGDGIAGATVRAVGDPLLDGVSGFDEVASARAERLELVRVPGAMAGGPVPGWVVRRDRFLPFPSAVTAADGTFRIRGLRPGNHVLLVQGEDHGELLHGRTAAVLVAPGRTTDIGIVAAGVLPTFELRFVDERKRPWVGAHVAVLHADLGFGPRAVRTDAAGFATLPRAGAGGTTLFARSEQGPWLPVTPDRRGEVVVPRHTPLRVVLVDEAGRLLPGGTVRAYTQVAQFRRVDRALPAGMQPRETSPGVHEGSLPCAAVLVASVRGFAPAVARSSAPVMELRLLPLHEITVRVLDRGGRPVEGALVHAKVHANAELTFPGAEWDALANDRVRVGRTDADGELRVPVWPTWFSFQCSHRDYADTPSVRVLPQPGQQIDLELSGRADVRGTVTIEGRAAPAGLRVRARQRPLAIDPLSRSGFLGERVAVTAADGTFALRALAAGIWELTPELPAIAGAAGARQLPVDWRAERVQLDEGEERHLVLEIQQGQLAPLQITGAVMQNGATVPRALVRLRPLEPADTRTATRPSRRRGRDDARAAGAEEPAAGETWRRCETDAFGTFQFRDVTAGQQHELRVDVPVGGRLQFVGRRVVTAGTASHPLRVDFDVPCAWVRLTCLRDGAPLRQRMVRLRQVVEAGEAGRYELLLDDNGQALVEHLPAGRWTIEPIHGGRCEPGEFEVVRGDAAAPVFRVLDR
jgi:hypothetical protein